MKKVLSFDDVLMVPRFSSVMSRKDVSTLNSFPGGVLEVPIMSSNMDSVTGTKMASAMRELRGAAALHRFMSVEDNVTMFLASPKQTYCSIGVGAKELERFHALLDSGCSNFIIDVAHGANANVVNQVNAVREVKKPFNLIVGNFATYESIKTFLAHTHAAIDGFKVGIGPGAACSTREVTGCGLPAFASILDCARCEYPIIADGGIRGSGDYAKALAAGADIVMLGSLLAGTDESLAEPIYSSTRFVVPYGTHIVDTDGHWSNPMGYIPSYLRAEPVREQIPVRKKYRGSASQESYDAQGKNSSWRVPEGAAFEVPYTGPVAKVIQNLQAGLKSAMSYVGASTLAEFRSNVEFVEVTQSGYRENGPHGKNSKS